MRFAGGAGGFAFPLGLRSLKLAERPGSSVVDLAERPRRREATSDGQRAFFCLQKDGMD